MAYNLEDLLGDHLVDSGTDIDVTGVPVLHSASVDPTTSADLAAGYPVGSLWFNTTTRVLWYSQDDTSSNAIWVPIKIANQNRIALSPLPPVGTITPTSGTAYWAFLDVREKGETFNYLNCYVTTGGSGAQTAEFSIAVIPTMPDRASKTIAKLVATGSVGDLTTNGIKRNTSPFNHTLAVRSILIGGIRTAMASAQPGLRGLLNDNENGQVFQTAASGVLTGTGPWTGAVPAAATTATCPALWATFD